MKSRILFLFILLCMAAACTNKAEPEQKYIVQVSLGSWHHADYTADQIIGRIDTVNVLGHQHSIGLDLNTPEHRAGIGGDAVLKHPVQIPFLNDQHLVLTAEGRIGAEDHPAGAVANNGISPGDPGGKIQIQQKIPAGQAALRIVGGSQLRDDGSVRAKTFHRIILQKILHQRPEAGSKQQQRRKKNDGSRKEGPAEGSSH